MPRLLPYFWILLSITLCFAGCGRDESRDDEAANTVSDFEVKTSPSGSQSAKVFDKSLLKTQNFFAMGTMVQVTTYDAPAEKHTAAVRDIEQLFLHFYRTWQPWEKTAEPLGQLALINQDLLAGRSSGSNRKFNQLVLEATELSKTSRGLFNPAIGELVKLWGFNRDSDLPKNAPETSAIQTILSRNPGMHQLRYTANSIQSVQPLALDFGGFIKGYAVDRAIDILRDYGIESALVNAGGDLRAIGKKANIPWAVGVLDPRRGQQFLAQLQVQPGEAIFTSGDYERYFEQEIEDLTQPLNAGGDQPKFAKKQQRYHHIIDPRTGYPATKTASVTVITANGAQADAAATALFVAGPGKWETVAISMGVKYVMMVDVEGNVYLNPAMANRIRLSDPKGAVKLSVPLTIPQ